MDDGVLARIDAIGMLRRWMETGDFPDRMMVGVPPPMYTDENLNPLPA